MERRLPFQVSTGIGKGLPQQHPLHRRRDFVHRPDVVFTQHRVNADRQGQGVLLVTEPHSELNAGLVVVFSSAHPSIFNWSEWTRRCRRLPDSEYDSLLSSASEEVVPGVPATDDKLFAQNSVLHGPQFTRKAAMDPVRVGPVSVSRHMHSVLD